MKSKKFESSKVKVEKLYEVQCEECGNPFADFFSSWQEAEDAKHAHIKHHRAEG